MKHHTNFWNACTIHVIGGVSRSTTSHLVVVMVVVGHVFHIVLEVSLLACMCVHKHACERKHSSCCSSLLMSTHLSLNHPHHTK